MPENELSFPDSSKLDLDRRLELLVTAANEVLKTQGRLQSLIHEEHAITSERRLESVMRQAVRGAAIVAHARSGTLTIWDERGVGAEARFRTEIDAPSGDRNGMPAAVAPGPGSSGSHAYSTDEASNGAALSSRTEILRVPMRIRGVAIGTLLLEDSEDLGFSFEDAQLVQSFASTAGFAIENARLYEQLSRSWE